jgi:hypothetical protein
MGVVSICCQGKLTLEAVENDTNRISGAVPVVGILCGSAYSAQGVLNHDPAEVGVSAPTAAAIVKRYRRLAGQASLASDERKVQARIAVDKYMDRSSMRRSSHPMEHWFSRN